MKKFIKINKIVLIIFIVIVIISTNCFATNVENVESDQNVTENFVNSNTTEDNNKLDELQQEKSEVESNLNETNSQIEIVKTELSDLLIKVEEINLEISNKNQELDKLSIENEQLSNYINNVQSDLKKITEDYNNKKTALDKRLVASYKSGKNSYLDFLLNSNSLIGFLSNYFLLSEIISTDEKLISDCSKAQKYMKDLEASLLDKEKVLEENSTQIQKTKIALQNMEALKSRRIAELSESEASLYAQIEEYHQEIDNIEREIRRLSLSNNIGNEYIGGQMAWPVPGYTRITSQFGMRTHPITGIYKLHTGTDIGAPLGATFISANDGVVIKAEYNKAYGNMVMINHGGGIVTLYAHGSEILVNVGDVVSMGTPVLKVGSTGYSTGPHAHFEVRVNGEYKNPLDYITSNNSNNKEKNNNTVEDVLINN